MLILKKLFQVSILLCCMLSRIACPQQQESPLISSFAEYKQMKESTPFGLEWISLGPVVNSARVEAVQLDPAHPGTMYVAFGSGNLWKTINNGLTWKAIFEDQPALGIGDIALAPSDPEIIYLGTGESLKKPRNFTMPGTGIYKSENGGASWVHCGLNDSWHIGEIAIHPTNPDVVFVAVLGHFWSTNPNRGLYRSIDGGMNWEQVLFIDEKTGVNDVVISHGNPDVLYASAWENFPGTTGGKSGVYTSKDGGETWERVTRGFPGGDQIGRIGVAVSHENPEKVYTLVDNLGNRSQGAAEVYKSVNGGKTWIKTHSEGLLIFSRIGWYFADIYVNPQDDDEIFALGIRMAHSTDGGTTFDLVGGDVFHIFPSDADPLHLDHCELFINPMNPAHLMLGNDGGLYCSYDKGETWIHYNNIPAGEFYDITVDNQDPYVIYGGTQDDATVFGPANEWDPRYADGWRYLWVDAWSGGDGCVTQVDPEDPNTVYFSSQNGGIMRKNLMTGRSKAIRPRISGKQAGNLQFNFVTPYIISPHDSKTLYQAGNYLFKSMNRGDSWEVISEDLSASKYPDKKSVAAGALAKSPLDTGLVFVGTDRGAFWVSKNDGKTWDEKSEGLANNYIRSIVASRYSPSRVYLAMTGINYDDLHHYLYVSEDYGENWKKLKGNMPDEIVYVICEDPIFEHILYAGSYRGVYVSMDRGESWSLMGRNMAAVAVSDLEIQERTMDLVIGTHGRGIYKINLKPIHEVFRMGYPPEENYLCEIDLAKRPWINDTHRDPDFSTVRKVSITYWVPDPKPVTLKVMNDKENIFWKKYIESKRGFNQYRWDLVIKEEGSMNPYFIHYKRFLDKGTYRLLLETDGQVLEKKFIVSQGDKPEN